MFWIRIYNALIALTQLCINVLVEPQRYIVVESSGPWYAILAPLVVCCYARGRYLSMPTKHRQSFSVCIVQTDSEHAWNILFP
jgi:hypothetical protein